MKIAFVSQPIDGVLPPNQNSLGIWIYEVARRLAIRHDVRIYIPGGRYRQERFERDGIEIVKVASGPDRKLKPVVRRLWRLRSASRPLFASLAFAPFFWLQVALDLRRWRADVTHTFNFSQFIPLMRAVDGGSRLVLRMSCEWLTQLDARIVKPRLEATDVMVGCSRYITGTVAERFPELKSRCETLHNGRPVEYFVPASTGQADRTKPVRILFVGRVSPEKGVHVLLDALDTVRQRHPKLQVDIIGGTTPAPREFIADISADTKVQELAPLYGSHYAKELKYRASHEFGGTVTFLGPIPHAELLAHYQRADIFVFPSIWDEPSGNPPIEAMACGVPVISTWTGGTPEYVEHGETGLLVEPGNSTALSSALLRLLEDDGLRNRMAASARKRAEDHFSSKQLVKKLEAIYEHFDISDRQ